MIPESELIRKEFVIRQIDFLDSVSLTKKSLLRWCCLSLGLISPKESREKGFLIFDALFTFLFTQKTSPTTLDIKSFIKEKNNVEMSEKLIRYHLNRVIELGLIKRDGIYFKINSSPTSEERDSLKEAFNAWTKKQVEAELNKISTSLEKLQKSYEQ
ncbi:MAG: hypothetical protein ACOX1V_02610 [Candidatus Iainarchaeum sp.]|jgi:hypothetical protein|nr:MAG: hypothetical protein BWY55_00862 [archaeon ADurb.Bin336]